MDSVNLSKSHFYYRKNFNSIDLRRNLLFYAFLNFNNINNNRVKGGNQFIFMY